MSRVHAPSRPSAGTEASLRVTMLHPTYWPEVRRGSERMIAELARSLASLGHSPRVITSHLDRTRREVLGGVTIDLARRTPGRIVRRLGIHEPITHLPRSWVALRREPSDVIHAFHPTEVAAAFPRKRPLILSAMGILRPERLLEDPRSASLWRWALSRSDAVIALSAAAARSLEPLGVEAQVIHPGVDTKRFRPTSKRAREPTVFCPATASDPRKRVQLLVEAMERVRARHPGARLVLDSPAGAEAPPWAQRDFVEWRFHGTDGEGLVDSYSSSWVTALTSRQEAFGLVLVEALACGSLVVGTREGGIPEIVRDPAAGELFEPDNREDLTAALLSALSRSESEQKREARREIAGKFSIEAAARAHESLYRQVIADRNGSGVEGFG